jgi:hypothetical protein
MRFNEFLKSNGEYSFARVVGLILIVVFQPVIFGYFFKNGEFIQLNNLYQFLVLVWPGIIAILLFFIQILKESKKLSLRIGDREYGISTRQMVNG